MAGHDITEPLRADVLQYMLDELRSQHLEVVRVGVCRVVNSENAPWYRELCAAYQRPRKRWPRPRTIIKRRATIAALQRMLRGDMRGLYAERIAHVAYDIQHEWPETPVWTDDGTPIPD